MRLPRPPIAVVFDMDGLLFDTERLYQEALHIAAAEAGCEVVPDFFNQTLGLPWPECRVLLLSHFGETFAVDDFQAVWIRHFWVIAETRLTLKTGVLGEVRVFTSNEAYKGCAWISAPSIELASPVAERPAA